MSCSVVQGHSEGELIAPELLNHVASPPRWKETHGMWKGHQRRTTDSLLHTFSDPTGDETAEEYDDLQKPRKVHHKNMRIILRMQSIGSIWKKAQDEGLQFWRTRSHASILYDSVPVDGIENDNAQRRHMLYQRVLRHDRFRKSCC